MSEQKIIKNQLIKNMMFNLIAFTIIFSIFGLVIYGQFSNSLYKSADEELLNSKNKLDFLENNNKEDMPNRGMRDNNSKPDEPKTKTGMNPRLIYLIRDEDGNVTGNGNIGYIYTDEYIKSIKFDKENLNKVYKISIDSTYQYRCINYKVEQNDKIIYVQVLINIDAEENIIESFSKILIICIIISIILSILASYILSKKTLKPIIKSWKKQTEFVQNASHELRTPLTIIQTKQELLLENPNSKIIDKASEITISLNETKRLAKLVKELMILARGDSSEDVIKKEKFDLDTFVKDMCTPYKEMAEIEGKEFDINLNYNKNINADKNRIHQLLVIVLDNAIKYTEKKEKIELCTYEKENKCVIEIKDTGIGISDETKKHMFERFYREDKARSRQTGGSGLRTFNSKLYSRST
ncbi:MAG TPA: HAMP domain-containing histidine kinase [Clostridiaceae bacterium]|nr:HAMP domain-containing histidine kinase [Clostridiaceae bacterium]